MKKGIMLLAIAVAAIGARGQFAGWEIPVQSSQGRAPLRTELVSYAARQDAAAGDRSKSVYYKEIALAKTATGSYTGQVDLPFVWRGRRVFLRVEGLPQFTVGFNGGQAGMSHDSRVMSEFVVSGLVREGSNTVTIIPVDGPGVQMETIAGAVAPAVRAVLMSQPTEGIEDFRIEAKAEAGKKPGTFTIDVAVVNATGGEESFSVGYDITSPDGKLLDYDLRPVTLAAGGRDTVRFTTPVPGAGSNLWSAASPKLYRGTIYIKYGDRNTEYVPFTAGFGATGFTPAALLRNGVAVTQRAARFASDVTAQATEARIAALRKSGVGVLCVDYPQPCWFYDICDRVGMYVVDQANINAGVRASDRTIGGAAANDPRLIAFFTDRVVAEYKRVGQHPCIVAWSLGGQSGTGYNMYEAYLLLKSLDSRRAVLYRGAKGDWNNDVNFAFPQ